MRRVEVDLGQYTKVLELDYQIEKNRKVRFLISSSKAIASALGVTRFNGFPCALHPYRPPERVWAGRLDLLPRPP